MDIKNGVIGALVGLTVLIGGLYLNQPTPAPVSNQPVGAVSSPDINSPYISFGGERQWAQRTDNLNQASTTICAIQMPPDKSALDKFIVNLTTSSTTAALITISTSTTPYATTTPLWTDTTIANGAKTVVFFSTTTTAIMRPNDYIVVGMSGGTGTFSPTGSCAYISATI